MSGEAQIIADNGPCNNAVRSLDIKTFFAQQGAVLILNKDNKTFSALQWAVCALSHSTTVIQDSNSVLPVVFYYGAAFHWWEIEVYSDCWGHLEQQWVGGALLASYCY